MRFLNVAVVLAFGMTTAAGCVGERAGSGAAAGGETGGEAPAAEEITQAMIEQGRRIYAGAGNCHMCHGPDAQGVQGLGSDLTDPEWQHRDGSFEGILETVNLGVSSDQSATGIAMPVKGGGGISDAEARAVAAYVYSLSHDIAMEQDTVMESAPRGAP